MNAADVARKAKMYLESLCSVKPNRRLGSSGNRSATSFFARMIEPWGYALDVTSFPCLDYQSGKPALECDGKTFPIQVSPYSLGCDLTAKLVTVSTIEELEHCTCQGSILLMKGALCAEQLMPKHFVFYNPDRHKKMYALLEEKKPAAIVTATARNPDLVGALYPFPLIEDGDFNIPTFYCTELVGEKIAAHTGESFGLTVKTQRIPSTGCNVLARKHPLVAKRILICAHIDAYGNSPGASDNASGTVVLLLLAEMFAGYPGPLGIEILAINGEDNYSAGGEMDYLRRHEKDLKQLVLAINIDDVGFIQGKSAYSFYQLPKGIRRRADSAFGSFEGLVAGEPWAQGDHMMFVQKGIPAIAITSERFPELMASVTHTAKDVPDLIDCPKLVEVASALERFITSFRWGSERGTSGARMGIGAKPWTTRSRLVYSQAILNDSRRY